MIFFDKITFLVLNILFIALPVALFEITMEKGQGWGSGLPKTKWYGKIIGSDSGFFQRLYAVIGIPPLFGYSIFMYGFLIPSVLVFEYFVAVRNLFLLIASYFTILLSEDLLWFVLNWYFPALQELFKGPNGRIRWHKNWVRIFKDYFLPRSYFYIAALIIFFFILA